MLLKPEDIEQLEKEAREYLNQADRYNQSNQKEAIMAEVKLRLNALENVNKIIRLTEGEIRTKYMKLRLSVIKQCRDRIRNVGGKENSYKESEETDERLWIREMPNMVLNRGGIKIRWPGEQPKEVTDHFLKELFLRAGCSEDQDFWAFLLYGVPGVRLNETALRFAYGLKQEGMQYLEWATQELLFSKYAYDAENNMTIFFQEAKKVAPVIVFLRDLEVFCPSITGQDVPSHIVSKVHVFRNCFQRLEDTGRKVILIATTKNPWDVDVAVQLHMTRLKVDLPDESDRAQYFDQVFRKVGLPLSADITPEYMGKMTERYSFRGLERVAVYIKEEIADSLGDLESEAAIREIKEGHCIVTKQLFDRALAKSLWSEDEKYLEQMEEWEKKYDIRVLSIS